jgi:hypothetical protein
LEYAVRPPGHRLAVVYVCKNKRGLVYPSVLRDGGLRQSPFGRYLSEERSGLCQRCLTIVSSRRRLCFRMIVRTCVIARKLSRPQALGRLGREHVQAFPALVLNTTNTTVAFLMAFSDYNFFLGRFSVESMMMVWICSDWSSGRAVESKVDEAGSHSPFP